MTAPRPLSLVARAERGFLAVEHGLSVAIGALLSVTAVLTLGAAALILWQGLRLGGSGTTFFVVIDRLLFVLMLAEILHTVRVSLTSGTLDGEPFLIVGLIASIRRVLVITLQSSETAPGKGPMNFVPTMVELGLLAVLILVMVTSIYLLRRARAV
ncbi:MAG: hypothetical protein KGK10_06500 [Rhodospirillales bacterium]|nr:hypothetical protein [Rhodospirillales bacterium]